MKSKQFLLKSISLIVTAAIGVGLSGCTAANQNDEPTLSSWTQTSPSKQALEQFVTQAVTADSDSFIPVEDRIATFDLDGTLIAEWPLSIVLASAKYRIETDLSSQTELVNQLNQYLNTIYSLPKSQRPSNYYDIQNEITTQAFAGLTPEQATAKVEEFMHTAHPDFSNLTYAQSFYQPMVDLVNYLQQNQFTVYLVSGSERDVMRGAVQGVLNLPAAQLKGSDIELELSGVSQGKAEEKDPLQPGDTVKRKPGFYSICIQNEKVYKIEREIGKIPVLAFGNSSDDFSMLNYALSNPDYPGAAFLLNHDDSQREYVYTDPADQEKCNQAAQQYGWHSISMKEEFAQVFTSSQTQKEESIPNAA